MWVSGVWYLDRRSGRWFDSWPVVLRAMFVELRAGHQKQYVEIRGRNSAMNVN